MTRFVCCTASNLRKQLILAYAFFSVKVKEEIPFFLFHGNNCALKFPFDSAMHGHF